MDQILAGLAKCLPGQAITNIQPLSAGWETDVYGLEAGGRPLVLRVYSGGDTWNRAEIEARAMKLLGELGYPVPAVISSGPDPGGFGGWYLIMDRIPGTVMWRHFGARTQDPEQLTLFVSLLHRLHSLDTRAFGTESPSSFSLEIIRTLAGNLREAFEPIFRHLEQWEPQVGRERRSLIHGDFHHDNVLITPDGAPYVIDWSGAAFDDPRADVAQAMVLAMTNGNPQFAERLREEYERQNGAPLPHLDFFITLTLARRIMTVVVTMVNGSAAIGLRPGLEEQLWKSAPDVKKAVELLEQMSGIALPGVHAAITRK